MRRGWYPSKSSPRDESGGRGISIFEGNMIRPSDRPRAICSSAICCTVEVECRKVDVVIVVEGRDTSGRDRSERMKGVEGGEVEVRVGLRSNVCENVGVDTGMPS